MITGPARLRLAAVLGVSALSFHAAHVRAQEPAECLSLDPADWPAPSRPYFMLAVDTSGSMTACTNPETTYPTTCPVGAPTNSCGLEPTRYNDAKCAIEQTVLAFAGQVNFGLSTFAIELVNCGADCGTATCADNNCIVEDYSCQAACTNAEVAFTGGDCFGCGPMDNGSDPTTRHGAIIRVPMLQDAFWTDPPEPTNVPDLLAWTDADCGMLGTGEELFAGGQTPINGMLRDMQDYFGSSWTHPDGIVSYNTPLAADDLLGDGVNGGTGCRDVNIILLTDGDETCDSQADAEAAAADLYQNGVNVGGKNFKIRTHVINFAGGTQANTDAIAAAGGTGSSLFATNEVQLAQALANIVAGAVQPEDCDNVDNNCNGCTDEGYVHYCNTGQTCCVWNNDTERDACLASYEASVDLNPPDGDLSLLPCTTPGQQQDPATWLCQNPGDVCDEVDNNCAQGVDEGQQKCGNPLACPGPEVCDGIDNDCNGQIDDGGVCGTCTPTAETCDGCDNDCDGIVDNGTFPTLDCGLPSPANCAGNRSCQAPQAAPGGPGTCVQGAGYGTCNNSPEPEVCDGVDNDCNGAIDEGYVSVSCEPIPGLSYGPPSVCTLGQTACVGGAVVCQGGSGPQSQELCDDLDNDCDGFVDSDDPDSPVFGVGQSCGINTLPCTPGQTACVNGALVCQGGTGPQPEVCDGVDNNCNGAVDEAPLADAPASPGCWNNAGTCCTQPNSNPVIADLTWCPPTGGTCNGVGSLTAPCSAGSLVCSGGGWTCVGGVLPSPEVCDGLDNDCSGVPDDGANMPQVGEACGDPDPPCQQGQIACVMGSLDCVGDIGPGPEVCNGVDDDCNTVVDDGIPSGGTCTPSYDTTLYPNSAPPWAANAPCQLGILECDFSNPAADMNGFVCSGGVGPSPELCDAIDNDCDGAIDEMGMAPDGLDGTANPNPPPAGSIGDACGVTEGACEAGAYACVNGLFACIGGTGPVVETCNCVDDDCDGSEDEPPGEGEPVLCSPGKDCIKSNDFCQCAEPCSGGEFPCPPGQTCEEVTVQGSGMTAGYCITDFEAQCGECETKTIQDGNGNVVCAPKGTDDPGCLETPECVCKGPSGCREPCFNVDCADPQVCSNFGPNPGTCVDDICYQTGCPGCNLACSGGQCVSNPCTPDSCMPGQVANPSADFMTCDCVDSCADVECPAGEKCFEGACIDWCDTECGSGEVCDPTSLTCITSLCSEDSCPNGAWCDPLTGDCGDDPCEGVICPGDQVCDMGSCYAGEGGGGEGGGGMGGGGTGGGDTGGGDAVGGGAGVGTGGDTGDQSGVFGLPTGGGGCACDLGAKPDHDGQWLALVGLGLAMSLRRRRRDESEEGRA